MRIHVCGARGSAPSPGAAFTRYGGDTSCIAVESEDGRPDLILDAGTGLRVVDGLLGQRAFDGAILLGHLHWDHIFGLPFFRAGDREDARVDVYAPGQDIGLQAALERVMSPPSFPITPGQLRGHWRFEELEEGIHRIGRYQVTAREIPHKGGRAFGYRVDDGTGSIAYLSDHQPTSIGAGSDGHGLVHDAALELADGVDLLIHDAQCLGGDWRVRTAFGHSTPAYADRLAREAKAARVMLFHHDPGSVDDELDALAQTWSGQEEPEVLVARQGWSLDVSAG